jgi:hypothetical protein
VLVRAGHKKYVIALHALETRYRVGKNTFVSVADMRLARSIGYCGRKIKFFSHDVIPLFSKIFISIAQLKAKNNYFKRLQFTMFKKKAFPAEKTLQMLRFTQHDNVLRLPSFGKPQYDTALSFCAGVALLCTPHCHSERSEESC